MVVMLAALLAVLDDSLTWYFILIAIHVHSGV
jgi:hypothetical protein